MSTFSSWFDSRGNGEQQARRSCRPTVELLEDRTVPYRTTSPWGTSTISYSYSNFLDGGLTLTDGITSDLVTLSQEAMGVWSSVAAIAFYEQRDSGPAASNHDYERRNHPTIRWGHHVIDGGGNGITNTLAHAADFPGGDGEDGDIHFDSGEAFSLNLGLEVAAHELGHAVGMLHPNGDVVDGVPPPRFEAIMHAVRGGRGTWGYNGLGTAYLLQDDIDGIRSLYGPGLGYVLDLNGVMHVYGTRGDDTFVISSSDNDIVVTNTGVGTMRRTMNGVRELWVHGQDGNDIMQVFRTNLPVTLIGNGGNDAFRIEDSPERNIRVRGGAGIDQVLVDIRGISATLADRHITFNGNTVFYNVGDETEALRISGNERSALTIIDTPTAISGVSDLGTVHIERMGKPFTVTRPTNVHIGGPAGTGAVTGHIHISSRGRVGLTVDDSPGTVWRDISIRRDSVSGFPGQVSWDSTVVFDNFQINGGRGIDASGNGSSFTFIHSPATNMTLNTGIRNNTVWVTSTSGPLTINGQGGRDRVILGPNMQHIRGLVTIVNSRGSTAVTANNTGDAASRTAILYTDPLTTFNVLSGLGADILMRGRDLSSLTIRGGHAGNQFRIHDTPDSNKLGFQTTIETGNGNDTVLVTGNSSFLAVNGQAGADTITFGRNGRVQNLRGLVTVSNALGSTAVIVDNSADDADARTLILYRNPADGLNVVSGLGAADLVLRGNDLRSLTIHTGDFGNFFRIHDTPSSTRHPGLVTTIKTGNGWDTLNVNGTSGALALEVGAGLNDITLGSRTTALDRMLGDVTVSGPGGTNNVTLDDRATSLGRTLRHTITPTSYTRTGIATVNFSDLRNLDVSGGAAADTFDVSALAATPPAHAMFIDGGGDRNTLDYSGYAGSGGTPPAAPPAPLSWYKADGDFTDSATANHGTPFNGVTFAAGRSRQAFSFDGVDDYIDLGNDPSLDIPGSVTFEAWINYQALQGAAYKYFFADFADGNTSQGSLGIIGERLFWHQTMTDGSIIRPEGATDLLPGHWYHVAVVRDDVAKTVKLYVNGVEDASQSYTGTVVGLQSTKLLGTSLPVGFPSDFFRGLIDEASIYNRALSADEIQARLGRGGGAGVMVNLVRRTATGVTGRIRRIENVIGSGGNDILVGNGGNVLSGGLGRDLLIAGARASTLLGGTDEDILIAGRTAWDNDAGALAAILAEWARTDLNYATRVQNLRAGYLSDSNLFGNTGSDTLNGNAGLDLFFADLASDSLDATEEEVVYGL